MEPITLTPKQIKEMEELRLDRDALTNTLEVALCFYSNQRHIKEKERREWWEEIARIHNLDLSSKGYSYKDGEIILTEDENKA